MLRSMKRWLGAGTLALATLAWAAAPQTVLARGGGGGHGGGGHGGGGHGGGGHYSGAHYGGYRGGGYYGGRGYYGGGYGGYGRGYGGYGYGGFFPGFGLGYGLGYGLGGGYGYGGGGYGGGYGYGGYGNGYGYPTYYNGYSDPGYYDGYGGPPYNGAAPQAQANLPAHVTVTVPPNADVYFNGIRVQQSGSVRQFVTPPLEPGNYEYEIRATWMENGQQRNEQRRVAVHPGEDIAVNFGTGSPRMAPPQP